MVWHILRCYGIKLVDWLFQCVLVRARIQEPTHVQCLVVHAKPHEIGVGVLKVHDGPMPPLGLAHVVLVNSAPETRQGIMGSNFATVGHNSLGRVYHVPKDSNCILQIHMVPILEPHRRTRVRVR